MKPGQCVKAEAADRVVAGAVVTAGRAAVEAAVDMAGLAGVVAGEGAITKHNPALTLACFSEELR